MDATTYPVAVREVEQDPNRAVNHAYFSWRDRDLEDMTVREAFAVGFRRGSQWTAKLTGSLSPHLAAFTEFAMWVMERPEDDIWMEPTILEPLPRATNGSGDPDDPW